MILENDVKVFRRFGRRFAEHFEDFRIRLVAYFPRAFRQAWEFRRAIEYHGANRFVRLLIGKLNHASSGVTEKWRKRQKQKRCAASWKPPHHRKCDMGRGASVQSADCGWQTARH